MEGHSVYRLLLLAVLFLQANPLSSAEPPAFPRNTGVDPLKFASPNETGKGEFGVSDTGIPDAGYNRLPPLTLEPPFFGSRPNDRPPVAGIQDLNGNTSGEVIIGNSLGGPVYVYDGLYGDLIHQIEPPVETNSNGFGRLVSSFPDINRDGSMDIGVCNATTLYLFDGATGTLLKSISSQGTVEGIGSFVAIQDITGNQFPEVVLGLPNQDSSTGTLDIGSVQVIDASEGVLLGFLESPHPVRGGQFGHSISTVPDVNGDGRSEILIGAIGETTGRVSTSDGRAYLFDGHNGNLLQVFISNQPVESGQFGGTVSGVPDLTGDGKGDVAIGAFAEHSADSLTSDIGRIYVFNGATGNLVRTFISPFWLEYGLFGEAIVGMEDVSGDGLGDILVGSRRETSTTLFTGRAFIFNSATFRPLENFLSENPEIKGYFGASVAPVSWFSVNPTNRVRI